jgi:hypothetical protein
MVQAYRQLLGTDTLGASRGYLNDSDEALKTLFSGPVEPESADLSAGMLWADTANNLLNQRNSTNTDWIEVAKLFSTDWGFLRRDRTGQVMQVPFDMGGNPLNNLGVGGSGSAARKSDVDSKAPLASPLLTGDARVSQDPAGSQSIVRRSWAEQQFVAKAGDTMTGRLGTSAVTSPGATQYLKRSEVSLFTQFDLAGGHRHNGTDSRKVRHQDLGARDITGFPELTAVRLGEVLLGQYVGDNTTDRFITLPWQPLFVWVILNQSSPSIRKIIALAIDAQQVGFFDRQDDSNDNNWQRVTQDRNTCPEISGSGFFVSRAGGSDLGLNDSSFTYDFIAIR